MDAVRTTSVSASALIAVGCIAGIFVGLFLLLGGFYALPGWARYGLLGAGLGVSLTLVLRQER